MENWKNGWMALLVPLALAGCKTLTGGTPDWVANPKTAYPERGYLVAVGAGDTRRTAENAAAANLSRIFEARIQSNERLLDQSHETNDDLVRTTDFTADINIVSAQTLYNIQHAEAWRDDNGRYHAVAYLERRSTAAIYRDKIDEQTSRVNYLLANAANESNVLKKYSTLRAAYRHAVQADGLLKQLDVIHPPSMHDATPSYSMNKLCEELVDAARLIKVAVTVVGDDEKRMTATLQEFVTGYGFMVGKPAVLNMLAKVDVTDTGERTSDLVFVRYELMLQIRNANGDVLVTVRDKGREAHKTLEQARTRSFRTLENAIKANGAQLLDSYFDSLVDQ